MDKKIKQHCNPSYVKIGAACILIVCGLALCSKSDLNRNGRIDLLDFMLLVDWHGKGNWLEDFKYRKVHIVNNASGTGAISQVELKVYKNAIEPAGFTFTSRTSSDVGAAQGVAFDGVHYYVTAGTAENMHHLLYKYDTDWNLVASRDVSNDDPTGKTQINHIHIKDGLLYIGANDYVWPDNVPADYGWIVVYNASDLMPVSYHSVKNYTCEGCAFYDGAWWVCYDNYKYLSKYDTTWNWVADYALTYPTSGADVYNGVVVIGDYFYINIHEKTTPLKCDVYKWNGSEFDEVARLDAPSAQCTQGICKDPDTNDMYWAERFYDVNDHRVVKSTIDFPTNSISCNGNCNDDFSDIRFTDADGITEFDYRIEYIDNGQVAHITVKTDEAPTSVDRKIYMYYGNL